MSYFLDHLVVCASDLTQGRLWAEGLLDVPFEPRGAHDEMGTHNHLVALDKASYFEVIARDPEAAKPDHARWFDLDNFGGGPKLSNWVVRCDDLDEAWERAPAIVGDIKSFRRGDYAWRMIIPKDGKPLFDGCFPTLIEWHSDHPTQHMPQRDLRLRRLKLTHPKAADLRAALAPFVEAMDHVTIGDGRTASLQAEIGSASGEIWIA
ncbi:glyoxalase-like protein [Pacificibacter maritimus]|uniref:Glyoxalase-like protein n=1 Tax=Pacificibacter maritimus TaxID=762213 RepID=A0A3N4UWU6_9RHOB|nr:VOC family protein [Pacificibacter maritimus]RPE72041.1 glyoxalase-like protein [Pacificibacter maritimus]